MSTQPPVPLRLILGGAPKSGTSSLHNWLNMHPALVGSDPKETFFLIDEDSPMDCPRHPGIRLSRSGWAAYARFFPGQIDEDKIYFDSTTHYLYQQNAASVLAGLEKPPVAVFLLREPAERIRSSFTFTLNNLSRIAPGFEFEDYVSALLQGDTETIGKHMKSARSGYVLERELAYSLYHQHLSRWAQALGPQNILVYTVEAFVADPKAVLRDIAMELKIDPDFWQDKDLPQQNATVAIRSRGVHYWARRFGNKLPQNRLKSWVKQVYMKRQSSGSPKRSGGASGEGAALQRLKNYFKEPNAQLEKEWQLDLSVWADKADTMMSFENKSGEISE